VKAMKIKMIPKMIPAGHARPVVVVTGEMATILLAVVEYEAWEMEKFLRS